MHTILLISLLIWAGIAHAGGFSRPTTVIECPCVARTNAAPDWSGDSIFRGIYNFEEISTPTSSRIFDSSTRVNHLTIPSGMAITTRAPFVRQQCRATDVQSAVIGYNCIAPICEPSDFCPVGESFTVGCWTYANDYFGVGRAYTMCTDSYDGGIGAGYSLGWRQTMAGVGDWIFAIDPTGGGGETVVGSFLLYGPEVYHHQVGRYFMTTPTTGTMSQVIDGVADSNTQTGVPSINTCDLDFSIGGGAFSRTITGFWDECFQTAGALDDESVCRIAVCGIDGCGCSCQTGDPTLYETRPRHVADGGTINCTMPACNQTTPVTWVTTTTTSSSTSTSSSSTTTTSTSSTTSTT